MSEEFTTEIKEELSAPGKSAGVEIEEPLFIAEPFDPSAISIEPKVTPMDTLLRRLKNGSIRLAPEFQRGYVWDKTKGSQLIESLMLRIPLPMFYVASDEKGNWDVVDGLQRLTTIRDFILGGKKEVPEAKAFPLENLEFWGERFNGKTFAEIERDPSNSTILNNMLETEMRFTIINPGTPEEVKRNIFKRINTGGMPLTPQEIRHALYQGRSSRLLLKLVVTKEFESAVDHSIDDGRMAGRELILRFITFYLRSPNDYSGDMDKFLSDTMRFINGDLKVFKYFSPEWQKVVHDQDDLEKALTQKFLLSMKRSCSFFGHYAFRKAVPPMRRTPVNKALFEMWSNIFSQMPEATFNAFLEKKHEFLAAYKEKLESSEFDRAISRDASSVIGVKERYRIIHDLINNVLEEKGTLGE